MLVSTFTNPSKRSQCTTIRSITEVHAVQDAARRVQKSGASWNDARGGKLDKALVQLDSALDASSTAKQRLPVLTRLVAHLQARRLLVAPPVGLAVCLVMLYPGVSLIIKSINCSASPYYQ